eukprot:5203288-Pyramimonas_sp.AAC.2
MFTRHRSEGCIYLYYEPTDRVLTRVLREPEDGGYRELLQTEEQSVADVVVDCLWRRARPSLAHTSVHENTVVVTTKKFTLPLRTGGL